MPAEEGTSATPQSSDPTRTADGDQPDYQLKMARNHIAAFARVTDPRFRSIYEQVTSATMLPIERLYDLYRAINYVDAVGVPGDIVEVGVWRGGAVALAARISDPPRVVWGYDTFEGHEEPDAQETDIWGVNMRERWQRETENGSTSWAAASLSQVRSFLAEVDVPEDRVRLVQGDIKQTALRTAPDQVAILRVDCDWYAESLATLRAFWPTMPPGAVLICDDYGHHSGQRKAVDEFFTGLPLRFVHVDYSCITAVKPAD